MKRFPSVKKNSDFQKAYQAAKSQAAREMIMYVRENGTAQTRLGVSCSKKVGNSVVRHTMIRKIREIFRLNKTRIQLGVDIIVVVRKGADQAKYQQLEKTYLYLCGRHHITVSEETAEN